MLEFELQEGLESEFAGTLDRLAEHDRHLKLGRLLAKLEKNGKLEPQDLAQFHYLSMLKSKKIDAKT